MDNNSENSRRLPPNWGRFRGGLYALATVAVYVLLLGVLFGFDAKMFFNPIQLFALLAGTALLYISGGGIKSFEPDLLSYSAVVAGLIQTCLLLFRALSVSASGALITRLIADNCRPLLYGFLIWCVFHSSPASKRSGVSRGEDGEAPLTASECYDKFRALGLTNREAEVALQACRQQSNCEIAMELGISETTVKKHLSNIFEKLGIQKRDELRRFIR